MCGMSLLLPSLESISARCLRARSTTPHASAAARSRWRRARGSSLMLPSNTNSSPTQLKLKRAIDARRRCPERQRSEGTRRRLRRSGAAASRARQVPRPTRNSHIHQPRIQQLAKEPQPIAHSSQQSQQAWRRPRSAAAARPCTCGRRRHRPAARRRPRTT